MLKITGCEKIKLTNVLPATESIIFLAFLFIAGSPFTVKVTGPGSNIIRETIKKKVEQVPPADINQECKLVFRLPGNQ